MRCIKEGDILVSSDKDIWMLVEPGWAPEATRKEERGRKRKREDKEEMPSIEEQDEITFRPALSGIFEERAFFRGTALSIATFWESVQAFEMALSGKPYYQRYLSATLEVQIILAAILAGKKNLILPLLTQEQADSAKSFLASKTDV
jgi:hypothetical protein